MNISIRSLSKIYGSNFQALKNIDLEIGSGIFGLLGPNGAGKTTLMRILVTLLEPTGGSVAFGNLDLGRDRRAIRTMIGYLPQQFGTFSKLKTWEFMDYIAYLAGLRDSRLRKKEVDEMLEAVGLYEARDRLANKLSGGMKRRLGIAQALIGKPEVIIVDEPTIGLDPEERLRFRNLMAELSHNDTTIILSTHIVGDISSSCQRMAILNKGALVWNESPERLIDKAKGKVWSIHALDSELDSVKEKYSVVSTMPAEGGWELQVVCDKLDGKFRGEQVEPNLEHAYVYFLEYVLGEFWDQES